MSARRRPRQAPARVRPPAAGPGDLPGWPIYLLLVVLTFIAYAPLFTSPGGWLWDDDGHVTKAALQSAAGLRRIWFDIGATQQVLPRGSFGVLARVPPVRHREPDAVPRGVCAASTPPLRFSSSESFSALAIPGAIAAALIFALHPVHVESVAWTSELKNTLSCVFFLGAALTYLRFESTRAGADTGTLARPVRPRDSEQERDRHAARRAAGGGVVAAWRARMAPRCAASSSDGRRGRCRGTDDGMVRAHVDWRRRR